MLQPIQCSMALTKEVYQKTTVLKLRTSRGSITEPVDTGCKLTVHKTFRRRSGRLLNILCTFNLRPVPKGEQF